MVKPRVLILTGDGINCERETALVFNQAGAESTIKHINDLLASPEMMDDYAGLALPGGFSFGDELGSGKVLALKLTSTLFEQWQKFSEAGKPIIGICNGFQALIKSGLLPFSAEEEKSVTLCSNTSGEFLNKWVKLNVRENHSFWLEGITEITLPIRHGEGRVSVKDDKTGKRLLEENLGPLRYSEDVNGSYELIAGMINQKGNVFGLMPHPEAYHHWALGHKSFEDYPLGTKIFENAVNYMKRNQ